MKKGLLSLSFVVAFISLALTEVSAQICTPDPLYTQPGIWPDSVQGINPAFQCTPYAQTLTIVVPVDTFVSGQALWIDSIVLTGIGGLPAGLSYACDPPSCGFLGGTTGCVLISGTPLESGTYNIDSYTTAYVTLKSFPISTTQNDTISYYNLSVSQTLMLTSSASNASCVGICDGSATVNPSGAGAPYTYIWNDPVGQTTQTANSLCAGVYAVTVSDTTGCYSVEIVTITNSSVLSTSVVTTDASCGMPNGSATATTINGTGPYTYIWSSGDTNNVISGLNGGTYTVDITDAAGCTDSALGSVGAVTAMTLTYTSTFSTCGNSDGTVMVSVSGGTPPYNGWGNGITDTTINGLSSGTYTIVITDGIGCVDSIVTTVSDTGGLSVSQSAITMASCNGVCDGAVTVSATGAVGTLTYSWNTTPVQSTAAITGVCAGTYVATVSDSVCTALVNVTITEPNAIVISSETAVNPSCNGAGDDVITIVASGGTGSLSYSINNGTTYAGSGTFTAPGAGTYTIVVMDAAACSDTGTTLTITEPPAVSIDSEVSMNISCNGLMDGSIVITASGGTGALSYSLDGGANYPNTTGTFTGLGTGISAIAVQDANMCPVSGSTITITEPAELSISVSSTLESGAGAADGTATVIANGGTSPLTIAWNTTPVQDSTTATALSGDDYIVTVVDANGCTISDTVTVAIGTGFEDISNELSVLLYPNPAQNELNIEVNLNYDFTFIAYDVRGKQVLAHSMMGGKNVVSLANLSTGLYVYHIINNSGAALSYGKFNVLK